MAVKRLVSFHRLKCCAVLPTSDRLRGIGWFYDRGAIKSPPHTGTSEGLSQAINRRPIRKFLPDYANVYVTIQSHGFSAGARTHYVTANGVRNGLARLVLGVPRP